MNLKIFVIRHWKAIAIALAIGLLALSIVAKAHAEPIDSAVGP